MTNNNSKNYSAGNKNYSNDNRSRQLNSQDRTYHQSRGTNTMRAAAAAASTTQANQKNYSNDNRSWQFDTDSEDEVELDKSDITVVPTRPVRSCTKRTTKTPTSTICPSSLTKTTRRGGVVEQVRAGTGAAGGNAEGGGGARRGVVQHTAIDTCAKANQKK